MSGSHLPRWNGLIPVVWRGWPLHRLAFDAAGDLYVADRENHRIQRFGAVAAVPGSSVSGFVLLGVLVLSALSLLALRRPRTRGATRV